MKRMRNLMTLAGLSVALLTLGVAGAKAQGLTVNHFAGRFTLTHQAQWGSMTLPAGEYTLSYGQLFVGGVYAVNVRGEAKGSPSGTILAGPKDAVSATNNGLVCVREGDTLIVRALELPAIGESISFAMPSGTELMALQGNHNTYMQLAEGPVLIQRVPVTMTGK